MKELVDTAASTAADYRIVALQSVGSTNDEALRRLRDGASDDFIVTAEAQTGGRGRHGRPWQSPKGNVYASFALRNPAPVDRAPQLGFVAGIALARTLRARLNGSERLRLKWPNDVLFGGAKLAGILLECTQLPHGDLGCVIGFGINCLWFPPSLPYPATCLREAGDLDPDPASIVTELGRTFADERAIWQRDGFAATRRRWLTFAGGLGEPIVVRTASSCLEGLFDGLDEDGRLRLQTGAGVHTIAAGDVFFSELNSKAGSPNPFGTALPEGQG